MSDLMPRKLLRSRFGRYLAVGAFGYGLNVAVTGAGVELFGLDVGIANFIAITLVFCTNFFLAKHFIFSDSKGKLGKQLPRFIYASLTMRLAEYAVFLIMAKLLDIPYPAAIALALVASNALKYVIYRRYVFPQQVLET